jgi:hypothetical protein
MYISMIRFPKFLLKFPVIWLPKRKIGNLIAIISGTMETRLSEYSGQTLPRNTQLST